VKGENNLTDQEKAILLGGFNTVSDDIEVYYVKQLVRFGLKQKSDYYPRAESFASDFYTQMPPEDEINDSIFLTDYSTYYSMGHEFYHIFSQKSPHDSRLTNLFHETSGIIYQKDTTVLDSKRLDAAQELIILKSRYTRNP
jgi:hypothetical protein